MGIILIKLGGFGAAWVYKDLALGIIRQQNAGPGAFCASNFKIELQSKKKYYIKFPSCIVEENILKNSISTPSSL